MIKMIPPQKETELYTMETLSAKETFAYIGGFILLFLISCLIVYLMDVK